MRALSGTELARKWGALLGVALLWAAALAAPGARAADRVALLIGNAAYAHTSRLDSPEKDVIAMKAALEALAFEVETVPNGDLRRMGRAIADFTRRAEKADTALLYYSGHGMEIAGRNYLIPVDAELRRPSDAAFEAIELDAVVGAASGARRLSIVVVDACRNNRFPSVQKDGAKGFTPIRARRGQLIAFATAPGAVAFDGGGRLSPYTQALTETLNDPTAQGLDVRQLFGGLGPRVSTLAGGPQEPFTHSAGFGREAVTLTGAPARSGGPSTATAPGGAGDAARAAFDYAKSIGSAEAFRDVADLFPGTFWGRQAAREAAALEKKRRPAKDNPLLSGPIIGAAGLLGAVAAPFRDCPDCPLLKRIPGGSFQMGSPPGEKGRGEEEGPQRSVSIKPFILGVYEITFEEWDSCAAAGYCRAVPAGKRDDNDTDRGWGRGRRPAIEISWEDVVGGGKDGRKGFFAWLKSKSGFEYRLPSEAEWEYAARAGTTSRFFWGDAEDAKRARYKSEGTLPVGSFQPNGFGLYDMAGNVWEWAGDCWAPNYTGAPSDGSPRRDGDCGRAPIRGGSWYGGAERIRSAERSSEPRRVRGHSIGFRVARDLPPS